jgi:copper resistance protein D
MTRVRTTTSSRFHLITVLVAAALVGTLCGLVLTAAGPVPGVTEPDAVVRYGLPVVRVLLDVAAVITIGLSLLPILVGQHRRSRAEAVLADGRRASAVSALVWTVCALVALVMQTAEVKPGPGVSPAAVLDYVARVGAGKALVLVAALALVSFGLGLAAVKTGDRVPPQLRTAVALFALLPLALTGHATSARWQDLATISLELHVLAAAAWTGGLGAVLVLLATHRALLATALPRFSTLATVCIAVVAISGLFNGLVELTAARSLPDGLFDTAYGTLVLLKLVCLGLLAALGARIRWRLLPAVVRQRRTALVTWAVLELGVMGLAIGLGVVLARVPVS